MKKEHVDLLTETRRLVSEIDSVLHEGLMARIDRMWDGYEQDGHRQSVISSIEHGDSCECYEREEEVTLVSYRILPNGSVLLTKILFPRTRHEPCQKMDLPFLAVKWPIYENVQRFPDLYGSWVYSKEVCSVEE